MKYLLMLASDEAGKDESAEAVAMSGCGGWTEEMEGRGVLRGAAGLRPASDATTVRVRGGEVLLSDGPFAETKDQVGGFSMIECADLAEAAEIASKHPWASFGQIEVRPVWEP
jgi:hypothetical protein